MLDLIKEAHCGLTVDQLKKKAKKAGIEDPFVELQRLVRNGLVKRIEKGGRKRPVIFKATPETSQ
ncbi:MAG: hypothetical protein ABSE04_04185 [Candidatus Microgenomates bacterium]